MPDAMQVLRPMPMGEDEKAERMRAELAAAAARRDSTKAAVPMEAIKAARDAEMLKKMGRAYDKPNKLAHGGKVAKYAKGGMVGSASKRADGIAQRGKTRGKVC